MWATSFIEDSAAELIMLEHVVREDLSVQPVFPEPSLPLLIYEETGQVGTEMMQKEFESAKVSKGRFL